MDQIDVKSITIPETFRRSEAVNQIGEMIKVVVIVPVVQFCVYICVTVLIMLFMERLYMGVVILLVKLSRKKPEKRYKCDPIVEDVESGSFNFPHALVQIPLFNERELYKLSIGAACRLSRPSDRLVIQVLDDSTDTLVKKQGFRAYANFAC